MKRDRDSDRREVMKKFTFKGVLDNFRTSVAQQSRPDQEIQETLRPEHFQVKRTFRHGFPFQPTSMAFDPVQKLLAIGSKCGSLRILGQPGVDIHVRHDMEGPPGSAAVLHLQFLVNEGALLSATADDTLHLWNFRQKVPQVVQSLKFQKEKITCVHLPLQSKWIYVGTEKGNVHVVQIENFHLSGYVINWNKAIEATRKTRPGSIVHLSDNPLDASKLLIGFESGLVVLWDLRSKVPEMRWSTYELRSITWHHEGKQFMCSHTDGTLTTWSLRSNIKYTHISQPLAKIKDGKAEPCKPINKVEWKTSKTGEAFVIFSGGTPKDQAGKTPCITVVHNKTTTVLEMEHTVIDFITLCESPYPSDLQDPYAIIALLQNDLVVMDLQTPGFPPLENPYPMDIHESTVTSCTFLADCPADLIPAFYLLGRAGSGKKQGFSEMSWPIGGGTWSAQSCSYSEVILTGHSDGTIKFWDSSAGALQVLYKLKTSKVFEKPKARSMDSEDEPFAIELISLCAESRKLCVAGASSHVILFTFKKTETNEEITTLEIPIVYEVPDEGETSPDCQFSGPGSAGSGNKLDILDVDNKKDNCTLKVRPGVQRKPPGFQAQMVCLTPWNNGEPPSHITALTINSCYGLMAYGNEAGIVIVDIEQKVCLLNIGSPDLYGAQDPYSRVPRSPKRNHCGDTLPVNIDREERQPRSPSIDQMNGMTSPASGHPSVSGASSSGARGRPDPPRRSRSQGTRKLHKCLSTASYSEDCVSHNPSTAPGTQRQQLMVARQYCSFDKLDNSFSRSRSSSMSSLENITSEAIQVLAFTDSFTKRSDPLSLVPSLWVGTSLGSVLAITIIPPDADSRSSQPVVVSLMGTTIFRLKGGIIGLSFLDCNGSLLPFPYESWRDDNKEKRERTPTRSQGSVRMSPTLSESKGDPVGDRQFVIITSEKQARVVALPSQTCIYRQQITDGDFVVKAETITFKDSVCLICYISNGHLATYSLPSLRPLMDIDFLPLSELRIARTFCFSNRGHGLYLATPSELQKFTICTEFCSTFNDMIGELFLPMDMPEPPKEGFFKGLFGGGVRQLDREELFGESSGKANKSVAKHIPGSNLQDMGGRVTCATGEVNRAHKLMLERGERLNRLEESAERMRNEAENFSSSAHEVMLKYRDKKWYQL
ncbi:syntaxin-binding protein 5 isoform X9 [Harmonia axyridis]|uniref:syntaxin-binding protein 5 isoform X9 n=1 Tax=Harmonia axyridis TaxID=115357 RepID=UPI001E275647|nr:syntaxin-binding protein 5 isoform X9 [Harmonia axyridis]